METAAEALMAVLNNWYSDRDPFDLDDAQVLVAELAGRGFSLVLTRDPCPEEWSAGYIAGAQAAQESA